MQRPQTKDNSVFKVISSRKSRKIGTYLLTFDYYCSTLFKKIVVKYFLNLKEGGLNDESRIN
jgi:hypothetical protein